MVKHPGQTVSRAGPVRFIFLISALLAGLVVPQFSAAAGFTAIERAEGKWFYASTDGGGVYFSFNRGRDWVNRSEGLPRKKVWPFENNRYRTITDIDVDANNRSRAAATTSTGLFLTENGGRKWRRVVLRNPVKPSNYITSVAFDPAKPGRIYLGTSFNGLFVSEDGGGSWEKLDEMLDPLYRGAGFFREITDITVEEKNGNVYLLNEFESTVYVFDPLEGGAERILIPETGESWNGINKYRGGAVKGPALELYASQSRMVYDIEEESWLSLPALFWQEEPGAVLERPYGTGLEERGEETGTYKDRRAIYLNAYNARGPRLEAHLDFMKRHGFNALVVDVKDDYGKLTYQSGLERPRSYGAVKGIFDLRSLIERAHEEGIYVIGRMVVFKDHTLYRAENGAFAVKDSRNGEPWGHRVEQENEETGESELVQREHWVDPFSEDVWDYNIEIAEELQRLGIDEVQFDYIRFPSDGAVNFIDYSHRPHGMKKAEAIESFIRKVRVSVSLPISTDLYGFNSWYRMGNWIGQDLEMLSRYVDVICPMYYPSHFPAAFLSNQDYIERAYMIYREGTDRAVEITKGRSVIRPYVQAFLIGGELSMEQPEYERYLTEQIEGTYMGGGSGYTLWNNMNRYYMVNSGVTVLNRKKKEPETDT